MTFHYKPKLNISLDLTREEPSLNDKSVLESILLCKDVLRTIIDLALQIALETKQDQCNLTQFFFLVKTRLVKIGPA